MMLAFPLHFSNRLVVGYNKCSELGGGGGACHDMMIINNDNVY